MVAFQNLSHCKVLVIGDLILDKYTIGKAKRISPEAPVPIVNITHEEHRPGGSGNVMLNLLSLGADVVAIGRIGNDESGTLIRDYLANEKVDVRGIFIENGVQTPLKNRIIADHQQMVRIDHEEITPLGKTIEQEIVNQLPELLKGVDVIAISDYGKGLLTTTLLKKLLHQAKNIPVVTDPKGIDFTRYQGSTWIKPNLTEAYAAANLPINSPIEKVAERLLKITETETLMITRSEEGISLFHQDGSRDDLPVKKREVIDVTGAGDTVLAMLAFAAANGVNKLNCAQLCNIAAGIAIEHLGCAHVTLEDVARQFLLTDGKEKIYDEKHLEALQSVLTGQAFTLLVLAGEHNFTPTSFRHVRQLKKHVDSDLLVYVESHDQDLINMMSTIPEVDFIIHHCKNLQQICNSVHPHEIYLLEGDKLQPMHTLEDIFTEAIDDQFLHQNA